MAPKIENRRVAGIAILMTVLGGLWSGGVAWAQTQFDSGLNPEMKAAVQFLADRGVSIADLAQPNNRESGAFTFYASGERARMNALLSQTYDFTIRGANTQFQLKIGSELEVAQKIVHIRNQNQTTSVDALKCTLTRVERPSP